MPKRIYKQITTNTELQQLQEEANQYGLIAVGVSKGKVPFAYLNGMSTKISIAETANYLNCTEDEARELVLSRGNYEFADEIEDEILEEELVEEMPEELVEEEVTEEKLIEENEKKIEVLDLINQLLEQNNDLQEKVNALLDAVNKLKEELLLN